MTYRKELRSLTQLSCELEEIRSQLYTYCQTKEFMPEKQHFADVVAIRKSTREIEKLVIVLIDFWIEKSWKK